MHVFIEAIHVGPVGDPGVEAQLVVDVETDQETGSDACGKAGNVDNGIAFVMGKAAPGGAEMIKKHRQCLEMGNIRNAKQVKSYASIG
jgi:hypothetical protein